ncbi:venom allergen 5 [Galendromus occidentalis]|uniref:Venom allergen 5 n=1 Tax=Galendromus occidentalis TaxID=34638 RepID=A0AAJ7L6U3_9ACAR|nr:venom allergen 5 [Galendromus occidentalis]
MIVSLVVLLISGESFFVSGQCPKRDIKCTYPVLKEFDSSGKQLLGHASCIRKECSNVVEHDNGESKQTVLTIHNEYRRIIALGEDAHFKRRARSSQGAGNMLQLVWDDNLAENAIKWAFQLCMDRGRPTGRLWRHDMLKCRSTDQFENVGQSLFWVHDAQGSMNWKHAIGSWFNQRFNLVEDQLHQPPGLHTNVTEFLQLIWADTFKVGCGYLKATFDNPVDPVSRYVQSIYVCNYGPQGNRPWQYVYRVGRAASNCPIGSAPSKDYKGLCKVFDEDLVRESNGNY